MRTRFSFGILAFALLMLGSAQIALAQNGQFADSTPLLTSEAILFGPSAVPAGDVDGDGVGDFIRGSGISLALQGPAGDDGVTVVSGATGELIWTLISPNDRADGSFGYAVAGVGDINADGRDDVIVGALTESAATSPVEAGRAYVFSGATGNVVHILAAPFEASYGSFGAAVFSPGDVNGDGLPDIAVGTEPSAADQLATQMSPTYVFSGASGIYLQSLNGPAFVEARTTAPSVSVTNSAP